MKCITNRECLEWLDAHAIDAVTTEGWPEIVGDYEIMFSAPPNSRTQALLAHDLVEWVGRFETALLWLTDWPFYKPEEMALISQFRWANGEQRQLIDAAGHLFVADERNTLIGWVSLMMSYGWDGYLFTLPFRGSIFQTSHEDFISLATSTPDRFSEARNLICKYGLKIQRDEQRA